MRLNNRGWSLQMMLVFCFVLILALCIAGFYYQGIINEQNKPVKPINPNLPSNSSNNNTNSGNTTRTYPILEKQIEKGAKEFQETHYINLPEDDYYVVTVATLVRQNIISKIYDINNSTIECSGYILFSKTNNEIKFTPYLKCGEQYITTGYQERLDIAD